MNLDLKSLSHWLSANKISLNAGKTEYIIFKHALKLFNYNFRLFIIGKRIFPSNCIKYLGVLIDSDLSWKSQINSTAVKLKRANGALAKIRHFVPNNVLKLVYYAIFHCHLQYCIQIWGQPNSLLINRINVLQNHAMRLMSFKTQRESASPLYADLEVLKFADMVHLENILFLNKLTHNKLPDAIYSTYAEDPVHGCLMPRAQNTGLFNLIQTRTTSFGQHSIKYNSILSWNAIQTLMPTKLADFENLKKGLKDVFIATYNPSD